jgi:hypothetical protein
MTLPRTSCAILLAATGAWLRAEAPPELRIDAPARAVSGTLISSSASLNVSQANVLSWSLSVHHEGLDVVQVTVQGTDFERLNVDGYAETGIDPSGAWYYSVGALSFTKAVALPVGTSRVLEAILRVARKDPGTATIAPTDGLTIPGDDREFANRALIKGGSTVPLTTTEKALAVTGCADFLLAVGGEAPDVPPSRLEVRRSTPLPVDVHVSVGSSSHLQPRGFSLGVAHDPSVLRLDEALFDAAFLDAYLKEDGFAQVEISERGFAAAFLSSATLPSSVGPGKHLAMRVSYSFLPKGPPGEVFRGGIRLEDGLPRAGNPVNVLFQPQDSLPCQLAGLPVDLVIGPDYWIRGDGNGDGRVNLTDAVVMLQFLFMGGGAPCQRAMEVNSDGKQDLSDAVTLLNHLFSSGPAPASPFPDCGAAEEKFPCNKFPCPAAP